MRTTPPPAALSGRIRHALAIERAQDHSANAERALDRPARVRSATQTSAGTTLLVLDREVRVRTGDDVTLLRGAGTRAAKVHAADGTRVEVDGVHAGIEQLLGRSPHLSERLESEVTDAIAEQRGLVALAAGWRTPGLCRVPAPRTLTEDLVDDQTDAVERSMGSDMLIVFGPPGTGKTTTLGRSVAALLHAGERVLLLAPTHAAVDTALGRVAAALDLCHLPRTLLLRQGAHGPSWRGPRVDGGHRSPAAVGELEQRCARLDEREWSIARLADALATPPTTIDARLERVEAKARRVLGDDPSRVDARALLRDVAATRSGANAAGRAPRLVAATLAEALVRPPTGPWDAVVIDEAAMASIPYTLWAASLARRRLLLWGDPRQLGPVSSVRDHAAREFLAQSLFHHLGCERAGTEDPRRPVLRTQHRMAPQIRSLVSTTFYDGMLVDGPVVQSQPGTVQVIDSAGLAHARASGGSRINETHAQMAAARADALWQTGIRDIAVVTPYCAQVSCLAHALRGRIPGFETEGGGVGTIHSAQGGEHDAVIVDLVATRDDPGRFLDERVNPEAASLLCVALSRPRTSLTILADVAALPSGGVARSAATLAARRLAA